MTRVPATIGIGAIIVLGSAMSACTNSGGNSVSATAVPPPPVATATPGVCVGSTLGSTPGMIQFQDKVQ